MGSSRITIDSHALIWYIDELLYGDLLVERKNHKQI
jgi:hypothetical protein